MTVTEQRHDDRPLGGKGLVDRFGRRLEYLRLSVTDRCNMRCFYCLPKGSRGFQDRADWLSFGEMERLVAAFARLGVTRVRLTGGEPLLRRNLTALAASLARVEGISDLSLSTNGALLVRHAAALREAGITRLNVSLDTLQPDRFERITGGRLSDVLDGLSRAKDAGFGLIKLNCLAMKGINDDELNDIVDYAAGEGFTLRFIEAMPVGAGGNRARDHYLDLGEVRRALDERFELIPCAVPGGGPARYYRVSGTALRIGFITPLSQHFCATCNRVRLGADGALYLCLGHEHRVELRHLLRAGIDDGELERTLRMALDLKPEHHFFHPASEVVPRFMSTTGG